MKKLCTVIFAAFFVAHTGYGMNTNYDPGGADRHILYLTFCSKENIQKQLSPIKADNKLETVKEKIEKLKETLKEPQEHVETASYHSYDSTTGQICIKTIKKLIETQDSLIYRQASDEVRELLEKKKSYQYTLDDIKDTIKNLAGRKRFEDWQDAEDALG